MNVDHSVARKLRLVLAFSGFLVFAPSLTHPFHFDDALILNDANITNVAHWQNFLNPLHLRQLTYGSFYLNYLIAGSNPATYHFVNVVIHVANAVLLFTLLDSLLERRLAFLSAAIFLVHPIQTEAVLYVYQRSILLACCFSLLALMALQKNRNWMAFLLFVCAFESKESAVAVPLLLAVIAVWKSRGALKQCSPGREPEATFSRRSAALLVILTVAMSAATIAILRLQHETTVGTGVMAQVSPLTYFRTETRVAFTYLRLLVYPFPQSLEYDFPWVRTADAWTLLRIIVLMALAAIGFYLTRSERWKITGLSILAFFILLTPTSTVLPSADPAFEHRLYLPMLAFSVFAASLLVRLKYSGFVAVPVMATLIIVNLNRGQVWATDASLWEDTVHHVPNKARAWFNLAGAYLKSDPNRARDAYNRAIQLRPDFAEAYYDLGVIDQNSGKYSEAVAEYERCIRMDPSYWPAWNNLGNTWVYLGQGEKAIHAFETTLRLNPDHWPSQYNLAVVFFNSSRFDESIPRLRTVLDWRPDFRDARYLLAVALSRTGQRAEAEREWHNIEANAGQPPMPTLIPTPAR